MRGAGLRRGWTGRGLAGKFDEEKLEGGMERFRKGEGRDRLDEGEESRRPQEEREVDRR